LQAIDPCRQSCVGSASALTRLLAAGQWASITDGGDERGTDHRANATQLL